MDDPWGSPWRSNDTSSGPGNADDSGTRAKSRSISASWKEPSGPALEPPPRAFLSPPPSTYATPALGTAVGLSPWADSDKPFADWTSPSAPAGVGNFWADANPSPRSALAPRDDPLVGAKPSPVTCPASVAVSRKGSSMRLPSLDPWSADIPVDDDSTSTPQLLGRDSPATDQVKPVSPHKTAEKDGQVGQRDRSDQTGTRARAHDDAALAKTPPSHAAPCKHQPPPAAGPGGGRIGTTKSGSCSVESRPTSPSDGDDRSDGELEHQDSPITSTDEDAKTRLSRERAVRRASEKIQALVDKFDGLAQQPAHPDRHPRTRERSGSRSTVPRVGTDDDVHEGEECGDFEGREERDRGYINLPTDPERPGAPVTPETAPLPLSSPPALSPRSPLVRRPRPVRFHIDYELVDKLLDGASEGAKELEQDRVDTFVPERIIYDSFAGISERKAWYRISRQGSIWRHNKGDEESYRRVAWPASVTHAKTVKIVRRWMEEDSITGRVSLGGGGASKGQNMFGWGSSEAPVSLEDVFKKRNQKTAEPPPPVPSEASVSAGRPKRPDVPAQHKMAGIAPPPATSSGWGSAALAESPLTPATPARARIPPQPSWPAAGRPCPLPSPPLSQTAASPDAAFTDHARGGVAFQPVPPPPTAHGQQENHADDDDGEGFDDDEWGEMVTSPSDENGLSATEFGSVNNALAISSTDAGRRATSSSPITALGSTTCPTPSVATPPSPKSSHAPWEAAVTSSPLSATGEPLRSLLSPVTASVNTKSPSAVPRAIQSRSSLTSTPAQQPAAALSPPTAVRRNFRESPADGGRSTLSSANQVQKAAQEIIAGLPDLCYILR